MGKDQSDSSLNTLTPVRDEPALYPTAKASQSHQEPPFAGPPPTTGIRSSAASLKDLRLNPKGRQIKIQPNSSKLDSRASRKARASPNSSKTSSNPARPFGLLTLLLCLLLLSGHTKGYTDLRLTEVSGVSTNSGPTSFGATSRNNVDFLNYSAHGGTPVVIVNSSSGGHAMTAFDPFGGNSYSVNKLFPESRNTFCKDPEWVVYANQLAFCQVGIHQITFGSPTSWVIADGNIADCAGSIPKSLFAGLSWPTTTYAYFAAEAMTCVRFDVQLSGPAAFDVAYDAGDADNAQDVLKIQGDTMVICRPETFYFFDRVTGAFIKKMINPEPYPPASLATVDNLDDSITFIRGKSAGERLRKYSNLDPDGTWTLVQEMGLPGLIKNISNMGVFTLVAVTYDASLDIRFFDKSSLALKYTGRASLEPLAMVLVRTISLADRGVYMALTTSGSAHFNFQSYYLGENNFCLKRPLQICTVCATGYYRNNEADNNTCITTANFPAAHGIDADQNLASPCQGANCGACLMDYTVCTTCAPGFWLNGGACSPCTAPCANCSTSAITCTSCTAGHTLTGFDTCVACAAAHYYDGSACAPCTSPCNECQTSATNCISCISGYNLTPSNTCIQCSAGTFFNGTICTACSSPCLNCTSAVACTSCVATYSYVSASNTCILCTATQFFTGTVCSACTTPCSGCSGNATTCTSCVGGYNYVSGSNTCIACSPTQYFTGSACAACTSPCNACTSPVICTTCIAAHNLTNVNTCISCASNQYFNGVAACLACNANCLTCITSAANCLTCNSGLNLTNLNTCISCSSNQYFNGLAACLACDANCLTCITSATNCLTCHPGFNKTPSNTCIQCASNQFFNGTICVNCPATCLTCTSATVCVTCIANHNLTPTFTCITCASNEFFNGTLCAGCNSPCATCVTAATQCLSCIATYNWASATNDCHQCTSNQYFTGSVCAACNATCLTCSGGTASSCLTCSPSRNFYSNQCFLCTSAQYWSGTGCPACHTSCLTCSGGTSTTCQSCATPKHLTTSNTCITCAAGNYFNGTNACVACIAPCVNCTSAVNCTSCTSGHRLVGSRCTNCPVGQFSDPYPSCSPCTAPCADCTTDTNNCLSCVFPKYLVGAVCQDCPLTQYLPPAPAVPVCTACSPLCQNCENSDTECTSCVPGKYLTPSKTCITCGAFEYFNGTDCSPCQSPCVLCSGLTICNSCVGGTHLTPSNTCITCLPTQRFNGTICVDCTPPCSGCSTSITTCSSCIANHFLVVVTSTCLFCNANQYFDGTFCQPCDPGCLSCANTATYCTACPASQFLTPSNTCITCGANQFFNGTACQNCTSPCATCSAAATCLTCIAAHFLTPSNTCITCAATEFFNGSGCSPCTSPCQGCSISATNCSSCIPTYHKTPANTCIFCTPSQFFTGSVCSACTSPCASCQTTTNTCTVCIPSYHLKTSNNTCVFCAQTQYFDGNICQNCSLNCLTCAGTFNNCTGCSSGQFLDGNAQCVPCHTTCASCTANTSTSCVTCAMGFQLIPISNRCAPLSCDPGQYLNLSTAVCDSCDSTCLTCALSANACTSCAVGRYLTNSACLTCHSTCTSCSGPSSSECSACVPGTQLSGTSCITSYCPPSRYMNNGNCTPCHANCLTCNGGNENHCQSCHVGKTISTGYCVSIVCPAGKYLSGNDCFNCNPYCATCQGAGVNDCLTCPAGFTKKSNGFCERNCASSEYNDNSLNLCRPCSVSCLTCSKAGDYGCASCSAGSTLRFDGLCLKSCSLGFYYLQSTNECLMCHSSCKSCSGPSNLECTECKASLLVQLDRSCKTGCPTNTFVENNIRCVACHSSCATCTSAADVACINCRAGLYKHPNGKCEGTIPEGYFLDTAAGTVLPCHGSCKSCEGPLETNCTSCKDPQKDRLSIDQKCIDCIANSLDNRVTCASFVNLKLTAPSANAINPAASKSVRLGFDGEGSYATTLTATIFRSSVQLEILTMNPSEYTLELVKRGGEYCVDIFSTVTMDGPVTLRVTPTIQQVLMDPNTGLPTLLFMQTPANHVMALAKAPNAAAMEALSSMTESSKGPMQAVSAAASIFATISILATTPLMTPFLKFLKIFKLLSRLKLINVFFGGYLEFVLMMSGMMFELGGDSQALQFLRFDSNTRGKLTKFAITPVSVETMWVKYMVYYLILLIRVYQAKLRVYIKKRKHFDPQDQVVDKIADESRIVIFTMVVIDIFFYSAHCVSHMNLAIPQSRDSTISLVLSCITIVAVSVDILMLLLSNARMNVTKVLWERKKIEIMARNDRIRDKRIQLWKAGTKHETPEEEDASGNPRKSPMPPKGLKENASEAAVRFFTEGIHTDRVQEGKYFNTISLLKLIAVEPFYVTLQMFPTLQIIILFTLQLSYFVYFLRMAFKKKIFISKVDVVQIFINELSILVFLTIGLIFKLGGGVDKFSAGIANGMQISGIVVVAITCILGAGIIVLSIIKSIAAFLKAKKFKKTKEEYNKVFSVVSRTAAPDHNEEGQAKADSDGEDPAGKASPAKDQCPPLLLNIPESSPSPVPQMGKRKRARNLVLRNNKKVTPILEQSAILPKTVVGDLPEAPEMKEGAKKKLLRKKKIIGKH
jgi:hypothetical protein